MDWQGGGLMNSNRFLALFLGITFIISLLVIRSSLLPPQAANAQRDPSLTGLAPAQTETPAPESYLPSIIKQPTLTPTPTPTNTFTPTPTMTSTPTSTPTNTPTSVATPAVSLICSGPFEIIPDDDPSGITNTLTIADSGTISDLDVYINIEHRYVGDIIALLVHEETDTAVTLIDRPGDPAVAFGCSGDNISAILDEQADDLVEDQCSETSPAISGRLIPNEPLDAYVDENLQGEWLLIVSDNAGADFGTLNAWCIFAYTTP
jgi:hypothetical protein